MSHHFIVDGIGPRGAFRVHADSWQTFLSWLEAILKDGADPDFLRIERIADATELDKTA